MEKAKSSLSLLVLRPGASAARLLLARSPLHIGCYWSYLMGLKCASTLRKSLKSTVSSRSPPDPLLSLKKLGDLWHEAFYMILITKYSEQSAASSQQRAASSK